MGCTSSAAAAASLPKLPALKVCLGEVIETGRFSEVRKASRRGAETNATLAAKLVDVSSVELEEKAGNEEHMWLLAGAQPNVLELLHVCVHKSITGQRCFAFVSELCQGSLASAKLRSSLHDQGRMATVVAEMCSALSQLHGVSILHRNIQPENFLLAQDGSIKLCDFGAAVYMSHDQEVSGPTPCAAFMAPEVVRGKSYSFQVDAWALGLSIAMMLLGRCPTLTEEGERSLILEQIQCALSQQDAALLEGLLRIDPALRWTAKQAWQHVQGGSENPSASEPSICLAQLDYECSTECGSLQHVESDFGSSWRS